MAFFGVVINGCVRRIDYDGVAGTCWHPRASSAYVSERARFSAAGRRAAERMLMAKRSGDTHVAATRLEFHPALVACCTFILRHRPHLAGGENIGDKTCLEV